MCKLKKVRMKIKVFIIIVQVRICAEVYLKVRIRMRQSTHTRTTHLHSHTHALTHILCILCIGIFAFGGENTSQLNFENIRGWKNKNFLDSTLLNISEPLIWGK